MAQLYPTLNCSIQYLKMHFEDFDKSMLTEPEMDKWPWDLRYYVKCIESLGIVGKYFLHFQRTQIDNLQYADHQASPYMDIFLKSLYRFVKNDRSLSSLSFNTANYITIRQLGRDYVPIKTVSFLN